MLGSPILYFKGMRILMFQLSGFYYKHKGEEFLGFGVWGLGRGGGRVRLQGFGFLGLVWFRP